MSTTRDVIEYAKRNGGVLTVREALALGMPRATLSRRVQDGIFVRITRGVLALPGTATRPDVLLRAAGRLLGAVVSHESAAETHGFEPIVVKQPAVTVSHRGTHRFPGVIVHQSTDLLTEHLVAINGLRITSPTRTIVDLAKVLGQKRLARVMDNALASGTVDIDELVALHASLTRPGKPGMKRLGLLLADRAGSDLVVSETELEAHLVDLLVGAGLPKPTIQFRAPWLKPIRGRVDLAYPDERVVVEGDSRRWHLIFDAFENDRKRDNAAMLAGWIVLRFTWRMVMDEPATVVGVVREAVSTRRSSLSGG